VASGKARLFPNEGGPAILEIEVPESIVRLADLGGEVRFEPGFRIRGVDGRVAFSSQKDTGAMKLENLLEPLVAAHLADNHHADVVRFTDELLLVAVKVGEVKCALASADKMRFESPGQDAWDVELGRAKSKLRMLCARLAVLCNENGAREVSIYGGEGTIKMVGQGTSRVAVAGQRAQPEHAAANRSAAIVATRAGAGESRWAVRFKNTPDEQEFTIVAE
jgi:hypothetical protein